MDELTKEQIAVLSRASPEQLEFLLAMAGHGVTGRKLGIFLYRLFAVIGVLATGVASLLYILGVLHGKN